MDGAYVANRLADALYNLGFPWNRIGAEGLKIVGRFSGEEAAVEPDLEFLGQMSEHFEGILKDPPSDPPLTFEASYGPSEHTVVDDLISSLEDLAGNLPWVAEPIHDILNDYDEYLESVKASKKLHERADRIRHSVSDLEDRASGRA
jgi:hypothetical protein